MGVFRVSSSSFDSEFHNPNAVEKLEFPNFNPNPENYEIIWSQVFYSYLILIIKYPDCINYEGKKILVFDKNITLEQLEKQGKIDPHFSNNKNFISPIARFEPTQRGLIMAKTLCETIQ